MAKRQAKKKSVFIPELRMTVIVKASSSVKDIRKKYLEHDQHEKKTYVSF